MLDGATGGSGSVTIPTTGHSFNGGRRQPAAVRQRHAGGETALSGAMAVSTGPLKIGGNALWSEWFAGLIDDVRIYDRALSATEIQGT